MVKVIYFPIQADPAEQLEVLKEFLESVVDDVYIMYKNGTSEDFVIITDNTEVEKALFEVNDKCYIESNPLGFRLKKATQYMGTGNSNLLISIQP